VREDAVEFAATVTRVLTEPALRAKLAGAGREFVERQWSSREMARRLLGLYEELVRTKRDDSTTTRYDSAA
jgi:glycosyltransferase involved in cell wall biosynthesis